MITQRYITDLGYKIINCAIEVHKHLGPGLLESVYQHCMIDELYRNNFSIQSRVAVPLFYKGKCVAESLWLDLLVENLIIVELKAIEALHPIHSAQLLSYLKLSNKPKGILINFNTTNISKNAVHLVTELFAEYKSV